MLSITEIVLTLVGPVVPTGEHNEDTRRLANLHVLLDVTDNLLRLIDQVASRNKNRAEASMKQMGLLCDKFLTDAGIVE